jgi:hypothetical protein
MPADDNVIILPRNRPCSRNIFPGKKVTVEFDDKNAFLISEYKVVCRLVEGTIQIIILLYQKIIPARFYRQG